MKRYVMLEDKEIVDTKDCEKCWVQEETSKLHIIVDIEDVWVSKTTVINQSDNLLDLREPMDILIVQFNDGFFNVERPIYATELEDYHKVIALIKNQGDIMRRYER